MLGQVESLRSPAPANTEDPDQSSLIRVFFVCHCVCIFLAIHVSVHVKMHCLITAMQVSEFLGIL